MKPNLTVVDNDETPSRLLAKHSEGRMALARLINDRLAVHRTLSELSEALSQLRNVQRGEREAAAALNDLAASETAAMGAWARNPDGPAPEANVSKREALEAAMRVAVAQAAAARQAEAAIAADQHRAALRRTAIDGEIDRAVAVVIAEVASGPALDDLAEAVRVAVEKQENLRQGLQAILAIARSGELEKMRPTFAVAERLADTLRKAAAPPAPDGTPASAAWSEFAAKLRRDPLAEFPAD